jgi:hypothetical protein
VWSGHNGVDRKSVRSHIVLRCGVETTRPSELVSPRAVLHGRFAGDFSEDRRNHRRNPLTPSAFANGNLHQGEDSTLTLNPVGRRPQSHLKPTASRLSSGPTFSQSSRSPRPYPCWAWAALGATSCSRPLIPSPCRSRWPLCNVVCWAVGPSAPARAAQRLGRPRTGNWRWRRLKTRRRPARRS